MVKSMIDPQNTLSEAFKLKEKYNISGIPVRKYQKISRNSDK